jgi:hypothetical protein
MRVLSYSKIDWLWNIPLDGAQSGNIVPLSVLWWNKNRWKTLSNDWFQFQIVTHFEISKFAATDAIVKNYLEYNP